MYEYSNNIWNSLIALCSSFLEPISLKKTSLFLFYVITPSKKDAYKRYFCWLNFPRCDEFGETLPMCQSTCENFFKACGYDEEMWVCSHTVENKRVHSEEAYRDKESYFPGEPFKKNEYQRKNIPKEICTPSIRGDASQMSLFTPFLVTIVFAFVQIVIM